VDNSVDNFLRRFKIFVKNLQKMLRNFVKKSTAFLPQMS
jgi:hypothetical protein